MTERTTKPAFVPPGRLNARRATPQGMPPRRLVEFTHCPNCHHNLDAERPRQVGDLWADPRGDTTWKGHYVDLSATLRILLHTLLTCADYRSRRVVDDGPFVSALTIAERLDMSIESAKVYISHLRNRFRAVDPEFDQIGTDWGNGWRWNAAGNVSKVVARSRDGVLVCYDNGTVIARNHRLYLQPRVGSALTYIRALVAASPDFVTNAALAKAAGVTNTGGRSVQYAMKSLRERIEAAGLAGVRLESKQRLGYRLVVGAAK